MLETKVGRGKMSLGERRERGKDMVTSKSKRTNTTESSFVEAVTFSTKKNNIGTATVTLFGLLAW